jgi:tRNA pseudouridine55 synthase
MVDTDGRILLIDKARGWTSFDVVKKVRNQLGVKKVGHAGTLDPLATGLLLICTGKMTKKINTLMDLHKEYTGTLVLGQTTPSHDLETEITETRPIDHITPAMIYAAADTFTGEILQKPPAYSAIRIKGKRAYTMARAGIDVALEPRPVEVKSLEITNIRLPEIDFRIVSSKGFYVRSFARDFGKALGSGAYLKELRRTSIGKYTVSAAMQVEDVV